MLTRTCSCSCSCAPPPSPAQGSNLPGLLQSKLNAPRILQVHKVASYALSKLEETGVHVRACAVACPACVLLVATALHPCAAGHRLWGCTC
jgi:hypothetical protein